MKRAIDDVEDLEAQPQVEETLTALAPYATQEHDHKGETIVSAVESCLLDWETENLFKVTLENASANDAAITFLEVKIEGLSEQNQSISWVRNVVKYVKSSCAKAASFKSYFEKVKLDTNGLLSLDVEISSLSPKTAEALICGEQWLCSTSKECKIEDLLDEIQKLETIEKEYSDFTLSID
ncbi:hypothetical protein CQW23_22298 [Capsicum baccatum]|uniref:HAT C-terminal dimerisation domain-containing protein n=1 Tax=Capsicum baccatum TaxID=33114 RepID=A0A2G2W0G6_CAPBA|nr:hypothetical protein CQW23_22298 [Capsicum baccatum]